MQGSGAGMDLFHAELFRAGQIPQKIRRTTTKIRETIPWVSTFFLTEPNVGVVFVSRYLRSFGSDDWRRAAWLTAATLFPLDPLASCCGDEWVEEVVEMVGGVAVGAQDDATGA